MTPFDAVRILLFIALGVLGAGRCEATPAEYANHNAARFDNVQACIGGMHSALPINISPQTSFSAQRSLAVLSWNVQKGENTQWLADLKRLGSDKQLVLLQEALLTSQMRSSLGQNRYWSFAPGYTTEEYRSGLMLLSVIPPVVVCAMQVFEPWLGSPKAVGAALFPISELDFGMLVINVHGVNFSIGLDDFERQMEQIAQLLGAIPGPAIVAGDFNTWREGRMRLMEAMMGKHGMHRVKFESDFRSRFIGLALDHIWIRGLTAIHSESEEVRSSDHNPMSAELMFEQGEYHVP
ncbi:endonuclease/exonuclease/phosphatase family protein [Alteromonas aestuariivivens]|uniref:Endonuclease/exonuclease/phosphatase family protein n=1 Tax=Alteromonas aestuariivivens TaxID=1938339 RepID=A0A3D8M4D8_9ALTE|nr:endonuclease/exonuclease/phosphatase family protein [Alteromonas aestuariivivens]RDV24440.1 endonuclease/exonuclease/phosphatase family protein [Alteromonas aestuariivivens]